MQLARRRREGAAISLVAMIDVLMILLVFFMVTSTYLDLDMVPLAGRDEADVGGGAGDATGAPLLLRLSAEGAIIAQGRALSDADLADLVAARLAGDPALEVIVLPSGAASVQALAGLMDVAVAAGAVRLRIVRLEAAP